MPNHHKTSGHHRFCATSEIESLQATLVRHGQRGESSCRGGPAADRGCERRRCQLVPRSGAPIGDSSPAALQGMLGSRVRIPQAAPARQLRSATCATPRRRPDRRLAGGCGVGHSSGGGVHDAVEVVARLKEESSVPLRSHGSLSLNRTLMAAGVVDRVQVTLFPVITGRNGVDPTSRVRPTSMWSCWRAGRSTVTSRSSGTDPPRIDQRRRDPVSASRVRHRAHQSNPGGVGVHRRMAVRRSVAARRA